jgi:hypothetical protein
MKRGLGVILTLALIISSSGCMAPFFVAPLVGGAIFCAGVGAKSRSPEVASANQKELSLKDPKLAESRYGSTTNKGEKIIIEPTEAAPNTKLLSNK